MNKYTTCKWRWKQWKVAPPARQVGTRRATGRTGSIFTQPEINLPDLRFCIDIRHIGSRPTLESCWLRRICRHLGVTSAFGLVLQARDHHHHDGRNRKAWGRRLRECQEGNGVSSCGIIRPPPWNRVPVKPGFRSSVEFEEIRGRSIWRGTRVFGSSQDLREPQWVVDMEQDMAAGEGSNARCKSSGGRWHRGIFLAVLHLLVVKAYGTILHGEEPMTRISFGSCANQSAPQPIWDAVLEFDPNLFIHLGDNIYADIKDPNKYFGKERNVGPFKNTPRFWSISPEALKIKYDLFKHGQPGYAALRKKTQIVGTWDDHDYGLNDAGKEYEGKDASQQLMLDFLDEASDSPRRKQQGVYAAYTYGPVGKKVKVILLDTRYHRDPIRSDGTMLGEVQWRWFENELRNSDAQIHIIGSSIQVVSNFSALSQPFFIVESWGMFPSERSRLYAVLRDTNASGVIFISGDVHFGEITRFDCGHTYPVYDITSSGLTEAVEEKAKGFPWSIILTYCSWIMPETMRVHNSRCARKPCIYGHANFGTFEIDWDAKPVTINVNVRDIHGTPMLGETLYLPDLQPGYFKSQALRGRHVQRHCTLEYDLPWYRKYILAFNFFAAVTVFVGALVTLLVLGVVRLVRPLKSPTLKED